MVAEGGCGCSIVLGVLVSLCKTVAMRFYLTQASTDLPNVVYCG